jgi:spore germination protein GerM
MKRLGLLLVAMVLVGASCSGSKVEIIATGDLPADIYGGVEPLQATNIILYMVEGNRLIRVARTGRAPGTPPEVAIRGLLTGPTAEEIARGIETKIPEAAELLGVTVQNGVAAVDLDLDFQVVQDPTDVQEYILRVAQLVWTLDEIPDITSVRLLINGEPSAVYDQFRREITTPVARGSYSRFEPRLERPVTESEIQIN